MTAKRPIAHRSTTLKPALRVVLAPLARHNARGMQQGRTVWVDPRRPWPAHTLLHEMVHAENPGWSETRVRRETTRRWRRMGWRDKAKLLLLLGRARLASSEPE